MRISRLQPSTSANTALFIGFNGTLDANGDAAAQIDALPLPTSMVGATLHFAYLLYFPMDFVSNAVGIKVIR